jgi:hypothetical protein
MRLGALRALEGIDLKFAAKRLGSCKIRCAVRTAASLLAGVSSIMSAAQQSAKRASRYVGAQRPTPIGRAQLIGLFTRQSLTS